MISGMVSCATGVSAVRAEWQVTQRQIGSRAPPLSQWLQQVPALPTVLCVNHPAAAGSSKGRWGCEFCGMRFVLHCDAAACEKICEEKKVPHMSEVRPAAEQVRTYKADKEQREEKPSYYNTSTKVFGPVTEEQAGRMAMIAAHELPKSIAAAERMVPIAIKNMSAASEEPTTSEGPAYMAAEAFDGVREGYVFKTGSGGLGYYADTKASVGSKRH